MWLYILYHTVLYIKGVYVCVCVFVSPLCVPCWLQQSKPAALLGSCLPPSVHSRWYNSTPPSLGESAAPRGGLAGLREPARTDRSRPHDPPAPKGRQTLKNRVGTLSRLTCSDATDYQKRLWDQESKEKEQLNCNNLNFPLFNIFHCCIRLAPCIPRWYFISIPGTFLCTITLEQRERQKTITFFSKWWIYKLLNYGMYCTEAQNPAVVILYISCKHLSDTKLHMWSRTGSYLGSVLTQHCDDIQVTSCSSESQCSQTVMWPSIQLKIEGGIVVGVNLLLLTPNDASLWTHMMFKKLHSLFFFLTCAPWSSSSATASVWPRWAWTHSRGALLRTSLQ